MCYCDLLSFLINQSPNIYVEWGLNKDRPRWFSGQRARLLLPRYEFVSVWRLQFFMEMVEKDEPKQKEAGVDPFWRLSEDEN